MIKIHNRKPDIENLYKVLRCEEPDRPTLFEIFMNNAYYEKLVGRERPKSGAPALERMKLLIDAFAAAGYDYATVNASNFMYHSKRTAQNGKDPISLNSGMVVTDEASFEQYQWPDPEQCDYSRLEKIKNHLPEGMKLMIIGPGGLLEYVTELVGYDNLCIMIYEKPELAKAIFDRIGSGLLRYYEIAVTYESVGLILVNDDWGFKTQPFLSPQHLREYIFPWQKKIVAAAHAQKKPAILHSCGYLNDVMDDVIEDMRFDGKHSFEDTIIPIEDAYERWQYRIGILGGIDMNYMVRQSEEDIAARSRAMLKRAEGRGGYALGTGNSVPEYIPFEHYLAMIKAAL
jgi:uroporphyrinogen decarboxylase